MRGLCPADSQEMPAEVNSKYPIFPQQRQVSDFSWKSYNHVSSPFFPDWTGRATGKHSLSPEHPRLPLYATSGSCVQRHTPICLDMKRAEGARSCWFQLTSIFIRINSNFTKCKFSKHNELLYFFKEKKKKKRTAVASITASSSHSRCYEMGQMDGRSAEQQCFGDPLIT